MLFGLVLLGGTRCIEIERLTRQIATGYTVFGRGLPLARQAAKASGLARLRLAQRPTKTAIFDVDLVDAGQTLRRISFASAANARAFAAQLVPMLQIDIDDALPAAPSAR